MEKRNGERRKGGGGKEGKGGGEKGKNPKREESMKMKVG